MYELAGRNAIVTGASRGIGVYIARALAARGVHVALSARTPEPIEALAAELREAGVRAIAVAGDVALAADRASLLKRAETVLGPIDILINNAAVESNQAFVSFRPADIEQMVQVDLLAPMLLTRALLPSMVARGRGHVVNLASLAGKSATPYNVPYSAAKCGLILFTHSLRAELRGTGVSASVIVPGFVAEVGMIAEKVRDHGVTVPPIAGASAPDAVARAVIRAIERDVLEIIVAQGPMRLSQAFNQLFPEAFAWFVQRIGALEPFKKVAESKRPP
jgi:short-subunit dehydrogenase